MIIHFIHFTHEQAGQTPCPFAHLHGLGEFTTELERVTCEECLEHSIYQDALAHNMEQTLLKRAWRKPLIEDVQSWLRSRK